MRLRPPNRPSQRRARNIQAALSKWSRRGLQNYGSLVFGRQCTYLPSDIQHLSQDSFPYEQPVPGKPPFLLR